MVGLELGPVLGLGLALALALALARGEEVDDAREELEEREEELSLDERPR